METDESSHAPVRDCLNCDFRLENLPVNARYCPRCGRSLSLPEAVLTLPPPKRTLRERVEQLRAIFCHNMGNGAPPPGLEQMQSMMVMGYADAMLHLGWRYEAGLGVSRNGHEAERCYSKSARLGNEEAHARLLGAPDEPLPVEAIEEPESEAGNLKSEI